MSEKTIYDALRSGGLSPVGACAMMGNMYCESLLKSDIVETRCSMSGADYTYNVDRGFITKEQFKSDAYGYGLCQWTYYTRKSELYDFAKSKGVSVGDEQMQCEFCLHELKKYYVSLYRELCSTTNLPESTKRICAEFERPAVNNYADRINAAQKYYNQLATDINVGSNESVSDVECSTDACQIDFSETCTSETCTVNVRVLQKGCLGRDVFLLQCGLFDMGYDCGMPDGDFGINTKEAVQQLQRANSVEATGVADWFVWQTVMSER